ncbi:autophagy protein [Coemansia interrupta]|uniref:Autophagy protein n=1 Tax=Coemansia interrupta TaxID=1126814 RepID=A0A9W8HLH1_9FUNG|nr:autophagy protein [Coemansia interrupta]
MSADSTSPTTQHMTKHRCKRCSRQVQFTNATSAWKKEVSDGTTPSLDALLQTLPEERSRELLALVSTNSAATQPRQAAEVSRFFSQSLRTDTVARLPNGAIARGLPRNTGIMRGSMALVLDGSSQISRRTGSPLSDADSTSIAGSGSQSDSFILLSSSQLHTQPLDSSMFEQQDGAQENNTGELDGDVAETFEVIGRLMDRLEERSAVGHPLCSDCADTMLRLLDREASDLAHENEILESIGRAAQLSLKATEGEDTDELERELERQAEIERALEETLGTLDAQLEDICQKIVAADAEAAELDSAEMAAYQELNDQNHLLERCSAEQWALDDRYARLAAQLTQLQRTNVYNDVFNITASEGVGSINGFRMGGRSSHGVEWAEINSAWGQALLLLQTVGRRLGHEFADYRLVPMGAFSRIERVSEPRATYELFGAGDLYLGRLFQNRTFDQAMVAYLACLAQIMRRILSINSALRVPYVIEGDKIGGASIRPMFGQDDVWTRACKNTLMNARWVLAFASSYSG